MLYNDRSCYTSCGMSMHFWKIEEGAETLRRKVAERQYQLWPSEQRSEFRLLDPEGACRAIGLVCIEQESLEKHSTKSKTGNTRIAGEININARTITVATEFGDAVKRFTIMHEVAHYLMHHESLPKLHRDRPTSGSNIVDRTRPFMEREADYFAACYLIPKDLILREFKKRFGNTIPLLMSDESAFKLCPHDPDSLLGVNRESHERELAVAKCKKFGSAHFKLSLAELFGVSNTAMAIRLKELKLVQWP